MKLSHNKVYSTISILLIGIFIISNFINCSKKDDNVIKIGAILSLTESAAQYGDWSKKGIDLAVSQINKKGGINGKKLVVLFEDDKSNPKDATYAYKKLVELESINIIIGPLMSSNVLSISPIAEKDSIIIFSPCASSPEITLAGDFIFRNWPSDNYEGQAMIDFIRNNNEFNRIAILYMNNDYGIGIKNVFLEYAQKYNLNIVIEDLFNDNETDFKTQLVKIKSKNPNLLYLPGHAKEVARAIKQAIELGINIQFTSSVAFGSPEIFEIAGQSVEGTIFTAPFFDIENSDKNITFFDSLYSSVYNQTPEVFAAHAFDAVNIISLALRSNNVTSSEVKNFLYNTSDFKGVTGKTTFDKNGDVIKEVSLKIVHDNNFQTMK